MADQPQKVQAVTWEVGAEGGQAWIRFYTAGANPLTIPIEPQAAFEMGENLARAAHFARHGKANETDSKYLLEQARNKATAQMHTFLINRITVMFNSMREDKKWSNHALATEVIDQVFNKVA